MINVLISLMLAIFSFQAFTITYKLGGINKTIINTPKAIFEKSIPLVNDIEEKDFVPYFNKELLESNFKEYVAKNLDRYSDNYNLIFYYYDTFNGLLCRGEKCDGVRITFNTKIVGMFDYKRTIFYEIRKNNG